MSLTPRQREVLALLVQGCTDREIAQKLFVAPSTIKNHIAALLARLDLANRVQLAVWAVQQGIA